MTQVDGMKIFRFETSIYFANAEHFRDRLYDKTGLVPRKLKKKKRKAMHDTLLRRKRELLEAELERKREKVFDLVSLLCKRIFVPNVLNSVSQSQ